MRFDQTSRTRPSPGLAARVAAKASGAAALLLVAATLVWPVGREVHAAWSGSERGPVTMERPMTRQPEIGQIAIPLHKRKKFEPVTATRQDMPYAWHVDSGEVYSRRAGGAAGGAASSAATGPAAQSTAAQEPTGEAPTTAYGHGGW